MSELEREKVLLNKSLKRPLDLLPCDELEKMRRNKQRNDAIRHKILKVRGQFRHMEVMPFREEIHRPEGVGLLFDQPAQDQAEPEER